MAPNKFATMLQRNTHKLTVILVYAFLEWILIILLLLNSFFTYLITKFANYFGLTPPCLWCSRVDHVLEPQNNTNSYRNLICETHANEISKLGYCKSHQKLAEKQSMCMDCLANSRPNQSEDTTINGLITRRIAFLSWVSTNTLENGEKLCSCCNENLNKNRYPSYLLFNTSLKTLRYTQKGNIIIDYADNGNGCKLLSKDNSLEIEENYDGEEEHKMLLSDVGSLGLKDSAEKECSVSECDEKEANGDDRNSAYQGFLGKDQDSSFEMINYMCCERNNLEGEFNRLIPVELIDSSTFTNLGSFILKEEDVENYENLETPVKLSFAEVETLDLQEMKRDWVSEQETQCSFVDDNNVNIADTKEQEDLPAREERKNDFKLLIDEIDCSINQHEERDSAPSLTCMQEDNHNSTKENCAEIPDETYMAHKELESNEAEDEKSPETPTSVDSFHYLHKKLVALDKRESGTEDSLDEMEGGDPVLTVEKLKTALKAERKVLNALYSELEEERSASAIAANQTMAMINRLQEEKAAMQMEALQYQRMMEEQSEYDQEALQLLNELMMKREREKQELEKELEVYRKKVFDYEAKEKMRIMRRSRDGSVRSRNSNSSATFSNSEDIDELSIDLNREARDEDCSVNVYGNQDSSNENTPGEEVINLEEIALDCVKQISALDDSLLEFEEERLSILDQLKALEEKLLTLHENELIEDGSSLKGFDEICELSTPEENGISQHELSKEKHYNERKTMGSMAKSLLPLLDAAENENEQGLMFEENMESEFLEMEDLSIPKFELDSKKLALEEEVDHVYERLQALEADREFLKHCMSSIKKGDKGMDLLQEILQHLRDLRAVELRVRNISDDPLG
ncbi:myosin-binding protein 2 isoform X2 [Jatropha curcas]|uniref:myosin-binding protein 2 isoform X2 n=1 Tax=Jatropha curcas TaxID=180498 RepID=UPI0005FBA5BD|nr:myosin-binding protein 2 isoform X2 [Jatropha curcas]